MYAQRTAGAEGRYCDPRSFYFQLGALWILHNTGFIQILIISLRTYAHAASEIYLDGRSTAGKTVEKQADIAWTQCQRETVSQFACGILGVERMRTPIARILGLANEIHDRRILVPKPVREVMVGSFHIGSDCVRAA